MPVTIPPCVAYQAPLIPIPAGWRLVPPEGDKFIGCEIDWSQAGEGFAVQLELTSFSPVLFSKIAALSVDNSRCSSDVAFLFPDTGKQLAVPAQGGGTFPVFTNALMFYVSAPKAQATDITTFQILNSMPPLVAAFPLSAIWPSAAEAAAIRKYMAEAAE